MAELGNDTTTAAFKLSEKALSALLQLIKYLMERHERKINTELKEAQLAELQAVQNERAAKTELDGKTGYIKSRELLKTGEPIIGANITLNDDQMKGFARYAKKYGLLYTSFSDKTMTGEKIHTFLTREKDLYIVKAITDRMTEDLNLGKIEKMKKEILAKGEENFTKKDIKDIVYLNQKIDEIHKKGTDKINDENAENIFKEACGEMKTKSLTFDHALNRVTDRDFFRDKPYYICERTAPGKYIELISSSDKFRDKEYTKTDYKVFNGAEQVLNIADERFEGRPLNYWATLRDALQEKGGFSDDIVIFNTEKEFKRYQELYIASLVRGVVIESGNGEDKNFPGIIKQLQAQLDKNNAEAADDGTALDKKTKRPLTLTEAAAGAEKFRVAESHTIAKQIAIYTALNQAYISLETDKARHNTITRTLQGLNDTAPNYALLAAEQSSLSKKVTDTQNEINTLIDIANELKNERNKLSGIQALETVNGETVLVKETNREIADTQEERRELANDKLSLLEWRGQVNEKREQIQRDNPLADKNLEIFKTSNTVQVQRKTAEEHT